MKYYFIIILLTFLYLSATGQKNSFSYENIDTNLLFLTILIENEKIDIPFNTIYLKKDKVYRIKIPNINNTYLQLKSQISHFEYLSSTPNPLKFLFPYSNNTAANSPIINTDNTKAPPSSIETYVEHFESLIDLDYKLYKTTKWQSDTTRAKDFINSFLSKLPISSIDEIPTYFQMAKEYLLIAETHQKSQITKWKSEDGSIEPLLENYAKIQTINANIQTLPISTIYNHLKASQQIRQGLQSPIYIAASDEAKISLTLYDGYINDTISHHNLNVYTFGDIDLDFSIGIFFGNLFQKDYYLESRNSLIQDIKHEPLPDLNMAFGALAHLSYHIAPKLKTGICLGTALSAFDENLQYLLGGSVIFGRQKQLVMSVGISFAQLNQLSAGVNKDSLGPYLSLDQSKIPTIKRGKTGYFLGISYNLIQIKKL